MVTRIRMQWRILVLDSYSVTMDPPTTMPVVGEDMFTLLKYAVLPIAKVLVMCALGLLLASRSVNILPAPSRKQLSRVRILNSSFLNPSALWFWSCKVRYNLIRFNVILLYKHALIRCVRFRAFWTIACGKISACGSVWMWRVRVCVAARLFSFSSLLDFYSIRESRDCGEDSRMVSFDHFKVSRFFKRQSSFTFSARVDFVLWNCDGFPPFIDDSSRLRLRRWFIPVNVVLASTLGCLVGYIVAFLVKPPPEFFNFTVVMIGIGTLLPFSNFVAGKHFLSSIQWHSR